MTGIASATGLLSARIRPVRRPKPKVRKILRLDTRSAVHNAAIYTRSLFFFLHSRVQSVELSGCAKAAPFALRPFAGLFNPYPYGCSVLCNHPADCEAKEVVRRAKDTWVKKKKNSYEREDETTRNPGDIYTTRPMHILSIYILL